MFKKIIVANRGEIAVRIVRACRDLGISSVALYDESDRGSLHVRLADECVLLRSEHGYLDQQDVIRIAHETGAEAIHPGYGFLAERPEFIAQCESAGLTFIGPSSTSVATMRNKIATLDRARLAGFSVPRHSPNAFEPNDLPALRDAATRLGYPLVVKSCSGGRGRTTRLVRSAAALDSAVQRTQAESFAIFGNRRVYLEQALLPSRTIEVAILGDTHGNLIQLGEHDGSLLRNNQRIIVEAPAPALNAEQREQLWRSALALARLFTCSNACTVEFLQDAQGHLYFSEIKPRLLVEHPLDEMITQIDIVREQLRIAAGEPLRLRQEDVQRRGWTIQCRINAEDPWNRSLPSPGRLHLFRLPGGPGVRVDTYASVGCDIPVRYDPLLAKLIVWGEDRDACIQRTRRALEDFAIGGIQTNLPLIQRILDDPDFIQGTYTTEFCRRPLLAPHATEQELRDLAIAAALAFVGRNAAQRPTTSERLMTGWHRDSRRL